MNEKPILFNAEMVRAILEGRKTQTRRPCKIPMNTIEATFSKKIPGWNSGLLYRDTKSNELKFIYSLFGSVGDQLWVRETFAELVIHGVAAGSYPEYVYRASEPEWDTDMEGFKWTPSIHMPREASRINLKVKRVWVERVQDISVSDCVQEGISGPDGVISGSDEEIKTSFKNLWESCGYDWDTNPFVWCCEFEVMK